MKREREKEKKERKEQKNPIFQTFYYTLQEKKNKRDNQSNIMDNKKQQEKPKSNDNHQLWDLNKGDPSLQSHNDDTSADSTARARPTVSPSGATSSWKTAIKEGGLSRPQDLRMEWELHQNDRRDSLHHQLL